MKRPTRETKETSLHLHTDSQQTTVDFGAPKWTIPIWKVQFHGPRTQQLLQVEQSTETPFNAAKRLPIQNTRPEILSSSEYPYTSQEHAQSYGS